MKLSIVIPVYNVEKYISKCLDSCINQNVSNEEYEIIVINDGSTDNSLEVCKSYSSYQNLYIFSQENMGLSIARNNGLKRAKGDYVWFVDSDDYIEDNCLLKIFESLKDIDILQIRYRYVYENSNNQIDAKTRYVDGVKTGIEIIKQGGVSIPAQFSIYRKEFLFSNNLFFFPHIYHEDVDFKPRVLYFAQRVKFFPEVVYNYLQRSGSISTSKGIKHIKDLFTISQRHYDFIKQNPSGLHVRKYFSMVVACNLNWVFIIMENLGKSDYEWTLSKLKSNKHLIRFMLSSSVKKYRIEALLLLINIRIGRLVYLKTR